MQHVIFKVDGVDRLIKDGQHHGYEMRIKATDPDSEKSTLAIFKFASDPLSDTELKEEAVKRLINLVPSLCSSIRHIPVTVKEELDEEDHPDLIGAVLDVP